MKREVYLDNNATTRPLPEVVDAVVRCMGDGWANPSSAHSAGRRAAELLERARDSVRDLINSSRHELVFTSGGTESNSTVMRSTLDASKRVRVITTTAEHSSIMANAESMLEAGSDVVFLPIDSDGIVDLNQLRHELSKGADLVAVHWVNSETGVIQPIPQVAELCAAHAAPLLVDGAQAIGKIPVDLDQLQISFFSFSGHKFHGPHGAGGLFVSDPRSLRPIVLGGDQEHGLRAGTHNLPAVVGLGEAARLRKKRFGTVSDHVRCLRDRFESDLVGSGYATINGDTARRVGNTTNLCFKSIDGQALLARLDAACVYGSQGSACTSHRPEPSHVLTAMGLNEDAAHASIRFSFSELSDEQGVEVALAEVKRHCDFLRSLAAGAAAV